MLLFFLLFFILFIFFFLSQTAEIIFVRCLFFFMFFDGESHVTCWNIPFIVWGVQDGNCVLGALYTFGLNCQHILNFELN